jgi:hypothetical protein
LVKIIIIKNHWSLETGISISIIEVSYKILTPTGTPSDQSDALFVWLISHQLAVLFSQNKPAITNQPAVFFSQNKPTPAISHQPNEQAVRSRCPTASQSAPKLQWPAARLMKPDNRLEPIL